MALGGPTAIGALHAEATLQHSAKRFPNPCHRDFSLQIVLQTGLDCRWLSVCLGLTPPPASNPACMNETRADSVQHGVCAAHCVCGICQLGKECADFLTSLCLVMPNQVQAQWGHTTNTAAHRSVPEFKRNCHMQFNGRRKNTKKFIDFRLWCLMLQDASGKVCKSKTTEPDV